jgi:hypothetical protein
MDGKTVGLTTKIRCFFVRFAKIPLDTAREMLSVLLDDGGTMRPRTRFYKTPSQRGRLTKIQFNGGRHTRTHSA